jgi:hypothetical protein
VMDIINECLFTSPQPSPKVEGAFPFSFRRRGYGMR